MVLILATGVKTSSKSIPWSCTYPFAMSQALYLLILPSELRFILKTHFRPIGLAIYGRSNRIHVLFFIMDFISSSQALVQYLDSFAYPKFLGSLLRYISTSSPNSSAKRM